MNGWEEFCLIDLESMVSPEILTRGLVYFQDGHVLETYRIGQVRAGIIAGTTSNYKVRLWLENGSIRAECSCPFQGFCKHLAALALAWLEVPCQFRDIEPELNRILRNPELTQETLVQICFKDPIAFYYLSGAPNPKNFHSARGILNLIRSTFHRQQISYRESAVIWENVERIYDLIVAELQRGNPEGLLPFHELLKGISETYLENPSEVLTESFKKLVLLVSEIAPKFPFHALHPLFEILLELYFEPKLWEWSDCLRVTLCVLTRRDPEYFISWLEQRNPQEWANLELIATVELLRGLESSEDRFTERLNRMEKELSGRPEGRLWLIDRYGAEDPERAFCLAKEGMRRSNPTEKLALRERMIQLHYQRREFKQAASLSFIQFREEPSFEEYLRLKEISSHCVREWERYFLSVADYLREKDNYPLLLMEIYLDAGDYRKFAEYMSNTNVEPELGFEVLHTMSGDDSWEFASVFPQIITRLLASNTAVSWKKALKLTVRYKKMCLGTQHDEEWETFRRLMMGKYEDDRSFRRKFGAILREA